MYSSDWCGFCMMARRLLSKKGVEIDVYSVDGNPQLRSEMMERSGRTSVPQIFIDGAHIGGCDDLHELARDGRLDHMLAGGGA
jgi:glutaredoxin 3